MKKITKILTVSICLILLAALWVIPANAAVTPSKPKGLEGESYFPDCVDLYWDDALFADGYRVFVRQNDKWKMLGDTEETYYEVENLIASTNYTFAVRSFRKNDNGTNTFSTSYSTVKVKTADMEKITAKAEPSTDRVKLSWTKADGASGYRLYYRNAGKWVKIRDVAAKYLSYTVKGLEGLTEYRFTVRPYAKTDKGTVWGKLSPTVKTKTKDPLQVQLSASSDSSSVTLKWDKISSATGYRVYSYSNSKWKALKTLRATTYTVTSLSQDTYYRFAVKAYKKVDGKTTWYPLSSTCKIATEHSGKNLKAYRIEKYDKIFEGNYYLETVCRDEQYGDSSYVIAHKNGYFYSKGSGTVLDGISDIYNSKNKKYYMILDQYKAYCVIDDFELDEECLGNSDFPVKSLRGKSKVYLAELDGRKVVCESYKDKNDIIYRYYFQADTLIAYDLDYKDYFEYEEDSDEVTYDRYYVNKLSTSVSSSYFKLPAGYKCVTMEELLEYMLEI